MLYRSKDSHKFMKNQFYVELELNLNSFIIIYTQNQQYIQTLSVYIDILFIIKYVLEQDRLFYIEWK